MHVDMLSIEPHTEKILRFDFRAREMVEECFLSLRKTLGQSLRNALASQLDCTCEERWSEKHECFCERVTEKHGHLDSCIPQQDHAPLVNERQGVVRASAASFQFAGVFARGKHRIELPFVEPKLRTRKRPPHERVHEVVPRARPGGNDAALAYHCIIQLFVCLGCPGPSPGPRRLGFEPNRGCLCARKDPPIRSHLGKVALLRKWPRGALERP